jgi:hypothetical protein
VTALSTAEAEYFAASIAAWEILYLRRILEDLGFAQQGPTTIWEDNASCIHMSETSVMYYKARHIDVKVYRLSELCKDQAVKLYKVTSADQAADSLTKATQRPAFEKHCAVMFGEQHEAQGEQHEAQMAVASWASPDIALRAAETLSDDDINYPWWV